jgi:hypothetical protein
MNFLGVPSAVFKVFVPALLDFIKAQKDKMEIQG